MGHAALLVDEATDENELAGTMTRVLTDQVLRDQLVARGRDRVREFPWEDAAPGFAARYRRLADAVARVR